MSKFVKFDPNALPPGAEREEPANVAKAAKVPSTCISRFSKFSQRAPAPLAPVASTYQCSECGSPWFVFHQPTICYWCRHRESVEA